VPARAVLPPKATTVGSGGCHAAFVQQHHGTTRSAAAKIAAGAAARTWPARMRIFQVLCGSGSDALIRMRTARSASPRETRTALAAGASCGARRWGRRPSHVTRGPPKRKRIVGLSTTVLGRSGDRYQDLLLLPAQDPLHSSPLVHRCHSGGRTTPITGPPPETMTAEMGQSG
jgi:hypothetical protein